MRFNIWKSGTKRHLLTFPCSTKEKNLSTSLLKAVIFISPCWSEDSMKHENTYRMSTNKQVHLPWIPILTLSSTISKEKSLPSPLELLQLRILDLLTTLTLMVHLGEKTLVIITLHYNSRRARQTNTAEPWISASAGNLASPTVMQLKPSYSLLQISINTPIIV